MIIRKGVMFFDLEEIVDRYVDKPCEIVAAAALPTRESLLLGTTVVLVEATTLSVDVRQFTGMTNALGRQVMVKMLKAFFEGSVALITANHGTVADFNGDGMITLFTGADRTERALVAASQIRWFLDECLHPKFGTYFERDGERVAHFEQFDAGFGIDDGPVLIGRVGTPEFSDIAWVGRCVNSAAKLCKTAHPSQSIVVTYEAYERLDGATISTLATWSATETVQIGGIGRTVLTTNVTQAPDVR